MPGFGIAHDFLNGGCCCYEALRIVGTLDLSPAISFTQLRTLRAPHIMDPQPNQKPQEQQEKGHKGTQSGFFHLRNRPAAAMLHCNAYYICLRAAAHCSMAAADLQRRCRFLSTKFLGGNGQFQSCFCVTSTTSFSHDGTA